MYARCTYFTIQLRIGVSVLSFIIFFILGNQFLSLINKSFNKELFKISGTYAAIREARKKCH